jgi:hypothetical protein
MGEDNFSNLIVSNSATQEAFPKNIVKQKARAPVTNPILTTQQIAKLKHDKSLDAFHARIPLSGPGEPYRDDMHFQ